MTSASGQSRQKLFRSSIIERKGFLRFEKGVGTSAYPLGYYQQVLLAFREFVDEDEFKEVKRRWGEALSEFDVI